MQDVVIVSAARTAIGKMGGAMKNLQPEDISRVVMEDADSNTESQPGSQGIATVVELV